jgi:myo-inositol 2-dehydrogenase/D-chiro-inositol 1-dehydrogenase
MSRSINLAVVGTGRMGSVHCRNIVRHIPEIKLVAICDIRLDVAQSVAAELGIQRVEEDYHRLLEDTEIEAVLIAASTYAHDYIIKDSAAAGKHIFCEKPIAVDLEKIDQSLQAVQSSGVKLQVGFNRRFDKSFQKVHEIVSSGDIGHPCILHITSRDPEVPAMEFMKTSGGMFMDMTIHDFDMARFQMGNVDEVYATGNVLIEPELKGFDDIDTSLVMLKFTNGAIGVIDNSRQAVYGYDQRLEVFCSHGTALAENEKENVAIKGDRKGFSSSRIPHFFMDRYANCYIDEIRQFSNSVRENTSVPVTGDDGRAAVVLALAAMKSLQENRPVKISEIG